MKTKIESKYFPKKLNNDTINKINNHLSIDINLNNKTVSYTHLTLPTTPYV